MKSLVPFFWLFRKSRYAEAMAKLEPDHTVRSSSELWSLYRLGLYATVAESRRRDQHWRGAFASAVSLAACGHTEAAADLARWLARRHRLGTRQAELAGALAPFAPGLAVELVDGAEASLTLRAALMLKTGSPARALAILRAAIDRGEARRSPELHLLWSNAERGAPAAQQERMNAFLDAYALTPVALRDDALPPGPTNLRSVVQLSPVHGPLVSIIMTTHQTGDRVGAAIASLLAQTYRDIEVIVVDDASSDDTLEVLQAWARCDLRVKYLRLPRNVGTYVAKRVGLHHASGEFVTCHDSDDWSHPLKIERQIRPLLENQHLVFTTSCWVRLQDDGVYHARQAHPLLRLNPSSPLFRRAAVLARAGVWDGVRTGADSEFIARLKLVFGRAAMLRVTQPLAFGAHRPNSLINSVNTGYTPTGISPTRLSYWEAWGHWHISELRAGRRPRLSTDLLAERPFPAPEEILVPRDAIAACLAATGAYGLRE